MKWKIEFRNLISKPDCIILNATIASTECMHKSTRLLRVKKDNSKKMSNKITLRLTPAGSQVPKHTWVI